MNSFPTLKMSKNSDNLCNEAHFQTIVPEIWDENPPSSGVVINQEYNKFRLGSIVYRALNATRSISCVFLTVYD